MQKRSVFQRGFALVLALALLPGCTGQVSGGQVQTQEQQEVPIGPGSMTYGVDEARNMVKNNPWTEHSRLKTLPAFASIQDEKKQLQNNLSIADMYAKAEELASALGLHITTRTEYPTEQDIEQLKEKLEYVKQDPQEVLQTLPKWVRVSGDSGSIRVEENGSFDIDFSKIEAIPKRYAVNPNDQSQRRVTAQARYLLKRYKQLLDMAAPKLLVSEPYTDVENQSVHVSCTIYDNSGSLKERILRHNADTASLYLTTDAEGVMHLSIYRKKCMPNLKLGDYPIISAKQARELLLQGQFHSTISGFQPSEDKIAYVDLIYNDPYRYETAITMPYYRFFVKIPGYHEYNTEQFGAFYVSAIQKEFLQQEPLAGHDAEEWIYQGK